MNIADIYIRYQIPKNLQDHMVRVAAVGKIITDSFQAAVDKELVVKTLLLHDMGNILKFNFDNPSLLAPEDMGRAAELNRVQNDFRKKYGRDADAATLMILAELGMSRRMIELCRSSHGEYLPEFIKEKGFEKKICYYADMRVGPRGILPLEARFQDLMDRYPNEQQKMQRNLELCLRLEQELQVHTGVRLTAVNDAMIETEYPFLRAVVF